MIGIRSRVPTEHRWPIVGACALSLAGARDQLGGSTTSESAWEDACDFAEATVRVTASGQVRQVRACYQPEQFLTSWAVPPKQQPKPDDHERLSCLFRDGLRQARRKSSARSTSAIALGASMPRGLASLQLNVPGSATPVVAAAVTLGRPRCRCRDRPRCWSHSWTRSVVQVTSGRFAGISWREIGHDSGATGRCGPQCGP